MYYKNYKNDDDDVYYYYYYNVHIYITLSYNYNIFAAKTSQNVQQIGGSAPFF